MIGGKQLFSKIAKEKYAKHQVKILQQAKQF